MRPFQQASPTPFGRRPAARFAGFSGLSGLSGFAGPAAARGLTAVLACGLALACVPAEGQPRAKLALLISIDTLRADHLGLYGYERPTSPTLDALARDAVVFDAAQSTSPWTLPAHGALLTGRYPSRLGLSSTVAMLPPEVPTLAELLRQNGWRTAAFVNSRFVSQRHGFDRGFDHFEYLPETYHQIGSAAPLLERAAVLIEEHRDQPLFVFVHLYDVHSDYRARHVHQHGLVAPYRGSAAGLTPQLLAVDKGKLALTPEDLAHVVDLYDAQIREVDANLGRFFATLRENASFDDSFIALVADHGDEFLEHGGVLHGRSHYREVIGVPLIIRHTGWPRGERVSTPVSIVDVVPTLLSALGVPPPRELAGMDLSALLSGRSHKSALPDIGAERVLYSEAVLDADRRGAKSAARQGRYTLHWDEASGAHELYDLQSDPGEKVDLARREPQRAAQLLAALQRFAAGARTTSERRELAPGEREELRQLGYLASPSPTPAVRDGTPLSQREAAARAVD